MTNIEKLLLILTSCAAVQILLLGLRLGGVIAWPWWLTLLPIIIPVGIFVLLALLLLIALSLPDPDDEEL